MKKEFNTIGEAIRSIGNPIERDLFGVLVGQLFTKQIKFFPDSLKFKNDEEFLTGLIAASPILIEWVHEFVWTGTINNKLAIDVKKFLENTAPEWIKNNI